MTLLARRVFHYLIGVLLLFSVTGVSAETNSSQAPVATQAEQTKPDPTVYVKKIKKPLPEVYQKVFTALENDGYFVVFEPNIGKNLEHFAQRWGDDYNKNKLEVIRSMVFCNSWYANQVSNADPHMLALCPLHMTLIYKKGMTTILFVRPSLIAANSPAKKIVTELEQDVIKTIERIVFY
jgi:uncharacterized protein (DUF302 family)